MSAWFLKSSTSKLRPYSASELRNALREGELDPFSDVYQESNPNLVKPIIEWDEIFSDKPDAGPKSSKEPETPDSPLKIQPLNTDSLTPKDSPKVIVQYSQSEFRDDEKTTHSERRDKPFGYNSKEAIEEFNKKEIQRSAQDLKAAEKGHPASMKKALRSAQKALLASHKSHQQEKPKPAEPKSESAQPKSESAQGKSGSREYYVVIGLKRMGPFPSSKIVEGYQSGMLSENALVAHGTSDRKVPISRFVEVYVTGGGKKRSVVPTPPRRASSAPNWALIGGIAALLAFAIAFWVVMRPNHSLQSAKPRVEIKTKKERAPRISPVKNPVSEPKQPVQMEPVQIQPIEIKPAPVLNPTKKPGKGKNSRPVGPSKNRLSTNRKFAPAPTMQLRARVAPQNTSIPAALAGKSIGSEISIAGLAFDQAAVRTCQANCQILFIDRSGNAVQVVFDAGSHRNTLLSKRGRVNISGFLTAGKKIILREVN